ncbi:MAG TPA: DsrE family protein [Marinilabiliales bacterium]|jgi:hypothetical protein|nr:hypothetical protein [Salinivirgaceae bacterium]OFX48707.1 MAG: DsrE family protein [Bacteroidetes bacterium GWA2_40_14]OFX57127.1 MAG: DsrE family protein [Bacteroidetes bacterium GWC2_40_13]OFX73171.1 MAG: DsrE family protein [Bacteroidetes bacterium GWD2_40_43]OFX91726.1 MAG: DsrE family protein [Bacteroidetes bacterium GWE2_40_63]OFY24536.1 MAG: DsrE family protein [Bacteroidetes bacterium GWF2_40_13]OFZ23826.1 MAG: DsrE family protein [Bacteroidetes bacterium RIFOXYC2_FULL_40_12]HAM9
MDQELFILWHSDNFITAEKLVFKYAINCRFQGWFSQVTIIIWGASSQLAMRNPHIQKLIKEAMEHGIKVTACKACADELESTNVLAELGVELRYWGKPLSELIQSGKKILSV